MITSEGAISSRAEYGKKLYRQANRAVLWCGVAFLLCGAVFAALYFIDFEIMFLITGIVIFAGGMIYILIFLLGNRKRYATAKVNTVELFRDYMIVTEDDPSAPAAVVKVYYSTLVKRRESKDYFLAFVSNMAFYPIGKADLTPAERDMVRVLLGLPPRSDSPSDFPPLPSSAERDGRVSSEEKEE